MSSIRSDIADSVDRLNDRLARKVGTKEHLSFCNCPHYGGYRLVEGDGSTGFGSCSGTEARHKPKEFYAYLKGIHDTLNIMSNYGYW